MYAVSQFEKQFVLKLFCRFVSCENFFFVLFEFGGYVAFTVLEGLFSDVLWRDAIAVGVCDFDVVTEDGGETDFKAGDSGGLRLFGLVLSDPFFAAGGEVSQFIEASVVIVANKSTGFCDEGAFVHECGFEALNERGAGVELIAKGVDQRNID